MQNWKIKTSLFLNYFVFAILLNSVGTVILQVQQNFGVSESAASTLEAFKDLSIAAVSFLISSYIVRIGYKNAMLIALGFISVICFIMPFTASFLTTKLLFAAVGSSFALIKMSVYSTIGLVTKNEKEHISLMNFIESFFMIGILTGYFIFSYFVDDTNPQSTQWLNVYYLLGGISLAAFLLLLSASLDESSIQAKEQKSMLEEFKEMFKLMVKPIVLVFVLCAFFYVLIEQSIMSWLPTFNNKVLLLPAALSIQMASILAGSTALGRFFAGLVLKKLNWLIVLISCLVLAAALVLVAIPLAEKTTGQPITGWASAPIAAFVFPMIGLLLAPIYPAVNSVILSTLPTKQHGLMSGLIIIFSALGGTTGSIITGNIFEHYDGKQAFYFSLIPMAILIVCLFLFNRLQQKEKVIHN
ncbi:MAG: MFS transporter [Sediminibacterium sp. Gen4]|jgi:MFS transporter, FHS family, glucose/mannose:H+ symporter|uniref:MFS transporter n=1 Tax=unclassified Sediminibacterium TaxID=2635961 RepID=UPI0015B9A595|nr:MULTISPECIES: MFS transporter [unclassified Sediminibacterium]MBW0160701.1 MFS transporter [Sediminibacterium sp.]MBW0165758.1 MFS transporter [Sediminibacterium sp.]NWK64725.1 MFS transporter [Sediminibacterium sp. Gen4]